MNFELLCNSFTSWSPPSITGDASSTGLDCLKYEKNNEKSMTLKKISRLTQELDHLRLALVEIEIFS